MDKIVFMDRDGTINEEKNYLYRTEDLVFIQGAEEAIRRLNDSGYKVVVVTNQAGVARGYYSEEDVKKLHGFMQEELKKTGAHIDCFFYCPHHPVHGTGKYLRTCECRKPGIGMFKQAEHFFDVDIEKSWMIGDNKSDIEAGNRYGVRTILVGTGYGREIMAEKSVRYDYYKNNLVDAVNFILKYDDEL